eukprot:1369492-Amorphochlora_amoeboformis.AAC.1
MAFGGGYKSEFERGSGEVESERVRMRGLRGKVRAGIGGFEELGERGKERGRRVMIKRVMMGRFRGVTVGREIGRGTRK